MNVKALIRDLEAAGITPLKMMAGCSREGVKRIHPPGYGRQICVSHYAVFRDSLGGDSIRDGNPVQVKIADAGRSYFKLTPEVEAILSVHEGN